MIIENARVFAADGTFAERPLYLEDGLIQERCGGKAFDARGLMAIPGLVDIHSHGARQRDTCDGTAEALHTILAYEASQGVLAHCPTTMTFPEERLAQIADAAAAWVREGNHPGCADLVGLNMEGPFISPHKVGAQNPAYVQAPDAAMFRRLQARSGGLFKLVTLAPEVDGALTFVDELADEVAIAVGHTCATYDEARAAFSRGARHVTHLWNAMPELLHRDPGPFGAAADDGKVYVELICDGIHIHPAAVRLAFAAFGDRLAMISDSMEATGCADGTYELGGQKVLVRGSRATLESGTIAGSATNLFDCMRWAVQEAHIPLGQALLASTRIPAESIGIGDRYGSLEVGKVANVVLMDDDLRIQAIFLHGEQI